MLVRGEQSPLRILHCGCGREPLPEWMEGVETRLDIDPDARPHVVASMTDMGEIGPFDMVYSSHAIEHLAAHEVVLALQEMRRVLVPGGRVVVIVPNLDGVRPTLDVLYESDAGPITGFDMIYGARWLVAANSYMAHKSGFVAETLKAVLCDAGFRDVDAAPQSYNLYGTGIA